MGAETPTAPIPRAGGQSHRGFQGRAYPYHEEEDGSRNCRTSCGPWGTRRTGRNAKRNSKPGWAVSSCFPVSASGSPAYGKPRPLWNDSTGDSRANGYGSSGYSQCVGTDFNSRESSASQPMHQTCIFPRCIWKRNSYGAWWQRAGNEANLL